MTKYDSSFLNTTEIADMGTYLLVPSPSSLGRNHKTSPREHKYSSSCVASPMRASRMTNASTAAFSDASLSGRSSTMSHCRYDSDVSMMSGTIKVADLLNQTIDYKTIDHRPARTGSKIRRDMFGNLRAVPNHLRLNFTGPEPFVRTRRGHDPDLDPMLNSHLYVDHLVERLSRTLDVRGVNATRQKFSGNKGLKGYWNPYLMMSNKSKYAQISNPNL